MGFPCSSVGKESPCSAGDPDSIPGLGRSLEKEMATHSSILAWKISWTEEPGGLQSTGSQRVGHDWATNTYLLLLTSWLLNPIIFFKFLSYMSSIYSQISHEHFLFPECSPLLPCFLWFLVPQPTTGICCSRDSTLDPGPFSYCVPSLGDPIHYLSLHYHSNVNHFLFTTYLFTYLGFLGGASGKEPACQCRRHKRRGFDPWAGKISTSPY